MSSLDSLEKISFFLASIVITLTGALFCILFLYIFFLVIFTGLEVNLPLILFINPVSMLFVVLVTGILCIFRPKLFEIAWFDDNIQENASDGSSYRGYKLFFRFFFLTSFIVTAFMGALFCVYLVYVIAAFFEGSITNSPPFGLFVSPVIIFFVIFIISALCIFCPLQKVALVQTQNLIRKKFSLKNIFISYSCLDHSVFSFFDCF